MIGEFSSSTGDSSYQLTNKAAGSMVSSSAYGDWFGSGSSSMRFLGGGAGKVADDIEVNEKTAAGYAPLWRAWSIICGYVSKLPLQLKDCHDEILKNRHEHQMMSKLPHEWIHAQNFKKTVQFHAGKFGNGYAYINRDADTLEPFSMTILDPNHTYPVVELRSQTNGKQFTELLSEVGNDPSEESVQELMQSCESKLMYATQVRIGQKNIPVKLDFMDMFHIRGLGSDGLTGDKILEIFQREIGLAIGARENKYQFYKNGGVDGGILMFEGNVSDTKQRETMRYWNEIRSGTDAFMRVAKLPKNTKFEANGLHARNMQTNESREFQIAMASNITGVPQHKLGGRQNQSYASLEQENKAFLDDSLDDTLCQWEFEAGMKLLPRTAWLTSDECFHFDRKLLQLPSFQELVEGATTAVNNGLWTGEEGRKRTGMQKTNDPNQKRFRKPLNIGFLDEVSGEMDSSQISKLQNVVRNQIKLTTNRLCRAAMSSSSTPANFDGFLATVEEKHRKQIDGYMDAVDDLVRECNRKPVSDVMSQVVELLTNESDRLRDQPDYAELLQAVARSIMTDWPDKIAKQI